MIAILDVSAVLCSSRLEEVGAVDIVDHDDGEFLHPKAPYGFTAVIRSKKPGVEICWGETKPTEVSNSEMSSPE